MPVDSFVSYLSSPTLRSHVDIVEVFGGMGGGSRVASRRRLVCGKNFDIVTGCDLSVDRDFQSVCQYFAEFKPKVLIGGPPCTAFSSWSRLHRIKNPTQYAKVRNVGVKLASRFAKLCKMQLEGQR